MIAGDVTFPRGVRLRTPQQYWAALGQGHRLGSDLFRMHLLPSGQTSGECESRALPAAVARLGITVSKRNAPLAVQRNRIKRTVRESFRLHRTLLPAGDYVVMAQREATHASPAQLRAALETLWRRVGALKPGPAGRTMPARAGSGSESR